MPRPVYSTRFLLGQQVSAAQSIAVPAGYVAVVRCVTIQTFHQVVSYCYCSVGIAVIVGLNDVPVRKPHVYDLRVVANAGESIAFVSGPELVAWSVSGYLLADPGA